MAPKFSLQPVLDYRHNRVERLEIELSLLLNAQLVARIALERSRETEARLLDELNRQQIGEVDLVKVEQLRLNQKTIENRIRLQMAEFELLSARVSAKQAEVVGAKQDEESLEILKDKEIERFQAVQAQLDNRLLDDIYISRAHQKVRNQ
jgi:flagellar export protein FliJ